MRVILAFVGVVVIWSTTPLAIKWSTDSVSFISGVALRMAGGALVCLLILVLRGQRLRWDRAALSSYSSALLGVYGAMSLVYFSVQYIPSGLVSVVFGVAPILSGLFARPLLGEMAFTPPKLVALLLSLGGLSYVFQGEMSVSGAALFGLLPALLATALFSLSGVLVKRTAARMDPLVHTTGSLVLSLPLFLLTWLLADGEIPTVISLKSGLSIAYLAVVGSVIGFLLYFYVLQRLPATKVALVPLITPVFALMLGAALAGEAIADSTRVGTVLILLGLGVYQLADRSWPPLRWVPRARQGVERL